MLSDLTNRFRKLGPERSLSHVLGGLLKTHYPGMVSRGAGTPEVPAIRWEDYKLGEDTTHGTKYEDVLQDFWVSKSYHIS